MDFSLGQDVETFREEVRALFAPHVEFTQGFYRFIGDDRAIVREMGRRGWLDVTSEGSLAWNLKMFVLSEEADRMAVPLHSVAQTFIVGFMLAMVGTEAQKAVVLPRIADGSARIALGYSEPDAGSDIAGTRLRARRDGEGWLLDGQKQWTSGAADCDYIWLLTRTDPDARKHAGLTIFLVPRTTPGLTVVPIELIGYRHPHTYQVFFDSAQLADEWRVGEVNEGWKILAAALVYEHGGGNVPGRSLSGTLARLLDLGLAFVDESCGAGEVDDDALEDIGRIAIDLELTRLLNLRATWVGTKTDKADIPGAVFKLVGRQAAVAASERLLALTGSTGQLLEDELGPGSRIAAAIQQQFRLTPVGTVAGGSVEIQRTKLAERGLGLPRPSRG